VSGQTEYAGGWFDSIGGKTRHGIAALDARTGKATAWNPHCDNQVLTLAMFGHAVYAGGIFNSIGGQTRHGIAALDARTAGRPRRTPTPTTKYPPVSGQTVYVGGKFTAIGGQPRNGIAALDARTGREAIA
jgi:hypothetical protein